jgi:hypothetical protein
MGVAVFVEFQRGDPLTIGLQRARDVNEGRNAGGHGLTRRYYRVKLGGVPRCRKAEQTGWLGRALR